MIPQPPIETQRLILQRMIDELINSCWALEASASALSACGLVEEAKPKAEALANQTMLWDKISKKLDELNKE